jgi:MoaA/NifB/PqqE/SkfB family radical SAM enzyme
MMKLPTLPVLARDVRFARGLVMKRPFDCLIQVTNRCNMKCSFCDFWPNPAPKGQELTVAEFAGLADQLAEMGTFLISIEGGEPFVRKDLVDIVRVFSERHLTLLFTAGWFVTEESARALWEAGLTHASVSIDFPDAARHDEKRAIPGATERAWRAVDIFRDSAPRGGKQVNVMSVLMASNWRDMEALFLQSREHGVGHQVTMLATGGTRRSSRGDDALPPIGVAAHMTALFDKYPHVRFFRDYFTRMDAFLSAGPMPTCHAGVQSFNIDHVGNVSACIERIDKPVGNVRDTSLAELHRRLGAEQPEIERCQQCWTACRGLVQSVGQRGSLRGWMDLGNRTRTY